MDANNLNITTNINYIINVHTKFIKHIIHNINILKHESISNIINKLHLIIKQKIVMDYYVVIKLKHINHDINNVFDLNIKYSSSIKTWNSDIKIILNNIWNSNIDISLESEINSFISVLRSKFDNTDLLIDLVCTD
jgi:hypothetical protein